MCQLCSRVCAHLCKRVGGGLSARAGFGDNTEIAQNKTIDVKPEMAMGKSPNLYPPCAKVHMLSSRGSMLEERKGIGLWLMRG